MSETLGGERLDDWTMPRVGAPDDFPVVITEWYETGVLPPEHQWLADATAQTGHEPGHVARRPEVVQAILFAAKGILVDHPEERDFQREWEVANMLYWILANGADENGNRYMSHWLRSSEVYESEGVYPITQPYRGMRIQTPQLSDIQGMRTYSYIGFGRNMGYKGTDLENEWFIYYRADGTSCDMPLRGITEAVDAVAVTGDRQGHLHEGPTPRGSHAKANATHFHGWFIDGIEMNKPKPFVPIRSRTEVPTVQQPEAPAGRTRRRLFSKIVRYSSSR